MMPEVPTLSSPLTITSDNIKTLGRVLLDSTADQDQDFNIQDFEDVKIEMFATGHNLVSRRFSSFQKL